MMLPSNRIQTLYISGCLRLIFGGFVLNVHPKTQLWLISSVSVWRIVHIYPLQKQTWGASDFWHDSKLNLTRKQKLLKRFHRKSLKGDVREDFMRIETTCCVLCFTHRAPQKQKYLKYIRENICGVFLFETQTRSPLYIINIFMIKYRLRDPRWD